MDGYDMVLQKANYEHINQVQSEIFLIPMTRIGGDGGLVNIEA